MGPKLGCFSGARPSAQAPRWRGETDGSPFPDLPEVWAWTSGGPSFLARAVPPLFPRYCHVRAPEGLLADLFPGPVTLVMERSEALNKDLNPFTPVSLPAILLSRGSRLDPSAHSFSFRPLSRSPFPWLRSSWASGFLTTPSCRTWPTCSGNHLLSPVPTSAPSPVL